MNNPSEIKIPKEIEEAASDWVLRRERGLSAAEEKALAKWIAESPSHAMALKRHECAWTFLERPVLAGRTDEMVRDLGRKSRSRRRRRLASFAAAGVLGCLTLFWITTPPAAVPVIASKSVVIQPKVQHLPDGTRVELREAAELHVDYTNQVRRVRLVKGEALFEVVKMPERPFLVEAGDVQVQALGTVFLVDAGGHRAVDVIVTEGRVAVARKEMSIGGESREEVRESRAVLDAGRRVTVSLQDSASELVAREVTSDELAEKLSWRATRLDFSYTPLPEAVALFNQHSPTELVVADQRLADVRVTGRFRADNIDTLVRLLEANFEIKAERSGGRILLRKSD